MENRRSENSDAPTRVHTVLHDLTSVLMNTSPIKHIHPANMNKFIQAKAVGEEKALGDISSIIKEDNEKYFASFEEKFAKFGAKFEDLELDVKVLKKDNKVLKKDNEILNTKVAHLEADNKLLKKDNEVLKKDNEVLNIKVAHLEADNELLKKDNEALNRTLTAIIKKEEAVEHHLKINASAFSPEKIHSTLVEIQNDCGEAYMLFWVVVSLLEVDNCLHEGMVVPSTGISGNLTFKKCGDDEAMLLLAIPQKVVEVTPDGEVWIPYELFAQLSPSGLDYIRLVNTAIKLVLLFEHDLGASQQEPLQLNQVSITGDLSQSNKLEHDPSQQEPLQLSQVSISGDLSQSNILEHDPSQQEPLQLSQVSITGDLSQINKLEHDPSQQEPLQLSQVSFTESPVLSSSRHEVVVRTVKTIKELFSFLKEHIDACTKNGTKVVFHFTCEAFANMILDMLHLNGGLKVSIQGQGNGGVYFSILGPGYYGVGTEAYEKNIVSACFGVERVKEYIGKNMLGTVIVYSTGVKVLEKVPNREGAVMIHKSLVQHLVTSNEEGDYFLTRANILGAYKVHDIEGSDEDRNQLRQLEEKNAQEVIDAIV